MNNDSTITRTVYANGLCMGEYQGTDEDGVLDAYARDAGYEDYGDLLARVPGSSRDRIELREARTVYDYRTGDALEGAPTPELVAESEARELQCGVCAAYLEGGRWHLIPDAEASEYEAQGYGVRDVWVA